MHSLQRCGFYRIPMMAKISGVVFSWSRDFEVSKLRLTCQGLALPVQGRDKLCCAYSVLCPALTESDTLTDTRQDHGLVRVIRPGN